MNPATLVLVHLRNAVDLVSTKVIPIVVGSDGKERPGGAFHVLHDDIARGRINGAIRRLIQNFIERVALTRLWPVVEPEVRRRE